MTRTILASALVALAAMAPAAAEEMTLEQVLEGHYESIGGLEAWDSWDTVRLNGTMSMMGGQMEAPYTITFANSRPSKVRLEFTLQGMTGIQASDGESAWAVMPFMGTTDPEPMPAEQAEVFADQMDFNGHLLHPQEKGHKLEYLGTEEMEGTPAHKIKVITARGDERTYYLDTDYFLPFKVESKTTIQGQEIAGETAIGDYKEVDGKVIAHSMSSQSPQGSQTITIDSVEFDVEVADEFFAMPEVQPAAEAQGG